MLNAYEKNIYHLMTSNKCKIWTIRIMIVHIFISLAITLTKPRSPRIYQTALSLRFNTNELCDLGLLNLYDSVSLILKWGIFVQIFFVNTLAFYSEVITRWQTPEKSMYEVSCVYTLVCPMTFCVLSDSNLPLVIQAWSLLWFPNVTP